MDRNQIEAMGKNDLRQACREASISYGKLDNAGMRAALKAHYKVEVNGIAPAAETQKDTVLSGNNPDTVITDEVEGDAPVAANPFGALLGNVQAPANVGTTTKVIDGKVVTESEEEPKAQPRPRVVRTPAPFVPKVVRKGYKIEKDRPVQNGVKRPSNGTVCGKVWDLFDEFRSINGRPINAGELADFADGNGWNRTNVSCEFYAWRKFNGIKGRQ